MSETREWLATVTDNASLRSVADRIGEYNVTFTRRLDAGDAHTIVAVAREYGVNPIPGLIAAGLIAEADLAEYVRLVGIDAYDDLFLAQTIVERIQKRQDSPLATVTEIPARRHDGTVRQWDDSVPHAADGSPEEALGREEWGEDPID